MKQRRRLREQTDHEVSMAISTLNSIIKNSLELKKKIGTTERDLPAWIQDHISNSENYIEQANSGYHDLNEGLIKESGFRIYHTTFTSCSDEARDYAKKKGYDIDEDDWMDQVMLGGRYNRARPSIGKTHKFSIGLYKREILQKVTLNFQVYGMSSGNFELNVYIA